MNNLKEKKEFIEVLFFHGITFDKKWDQLYYASYETPITDINKYTYGKYSRYCIAGRYNYIDKQLELGLSMLEHPHPYIRKKAREVAINHLDNKTDFSINIPFKVLEQMYEYEFGNEIHVFNDLNIFINYFNRGRLIYFFKDKKVYKLAE